MLREWFDDMEAIGKQAERERVDATRISQAVAADEARRAKLAAQVRETRETAAVALPSAPALPVAVRPVPFYRRDAPAVRLVGWSERLRVCYWLLKIGMLLAILVYYDNLLAYFGEQVGRNASLFLSGAFRGVTGR